jgi:hypothetical protein
LSQIIPTKPLGVDMNRVLAIKTVVDRLCEGTLRGEQARPALVLAGNLPPVSTLRRLEVFTGAGRRRRWSDEDKARIVAEIVASGGSVCSVAFPPIKLRSRRNLGCA